jgi:hypothetical protein
VVRCPGLGERVGLLGFPGLDIPVRGQGRESLVRLLERYVRAWSNYEATVKE